MARIRTLKPEMWGTGDISRLSRDERLLVVGLITMADDDGRFLSAPNAILGHIYPNDSNISPAQIMRWLTNAAEGDEPVHLYDFDGIAYGCFPNWHKHQRINRYTASKYPSPLIECWPRKSGGVSDE